VSSRSERKPSVLRIWRVGEHWCVVGDNGIGFYVGYVSVPEGHPWYEQGYDDIAADAHGGLTFADFRDDAAWDRWEGHDGVPPGFYVGFDCGHYCCSPIPGSYMSEHWPTGEVFHPPWTPELVADEVNRLAVQAQVAQVAAHA
jgi:hypothetical protein